MPSPVDPQPRRRTREWPIAVVLAGALAGLAVVASDRFRPGTALLATAVLVGAVLRAVLPERRAGLLVVRSRPVDVLTLLVLGVGMLVLAVAVPPPPA